MRQITLLLAIFVSFSFAVDVHAQESCGGEMSELIRTGERLAKRGNYHIEPATPDSAKALVSRIRECDPMRDYFAYGGIIKSDQYGFKDETEYPEPNKSVIKLKNMQTVSRKLAWIDDVFTSLPLEDRDGVVEKAMPLVADFVVDYLHKDHLEGWLLDLQWSKDIQPVKPSWYQEINWPDDRSKAVQIDGYDQKLSKIDLWVRMWWKRRGKPLFKRAKKAVKKKVEQR